MYNRFEGGLHPRENIYDIISAAKDHSSSVEDHVLLLEKRVTQICKLLGKNDETIQRKLQGFLSMDSIEGYLSSHIGDVSVTGKTGGAGDVMAHSTNSEPPINGRQPVVSLKSDSESGFDESSSQMSRSGLDDTTGLSRSASTDQLSLDQLLQELKTVAVGWRSFRGVHSCSCASPFDHYAKKFHCWKCGNVFCVRCIARNIPLPGHYHRRPVPVCKPCYKEVKRSPSVELLAS